MSRQAQVETSDLERREFQLNIFACLAIFVLAAGLALLMYPAVFSSRDMPPNRTAQIAFFGFCTLSCLLVAYILNRQVMIQGLRHQIAEDRKRTLEASKQASADLLGAIPNFNSFEDRLAMEFRRAVAADLKLSVLVTAVKLNGAYSEPIMEMSALGDAARVISRKLREQDSIYVLRSGYFGLILPDTDTSMARRLLGRLSEGLSDAAGANDRFTFKIDVINYPEQTSSAHDLELAVCGLLPEEGSKQASASEEYVHL